jgi:uncharacterized membrane protein YkgB
METRQQSENTRRRLLGRILVILGSIALIADLSFLAQPIERIAEKLSNGLFALLPSVGLSFLHAASAIVFHQVDYFSLVARILVLFTAMVAVIVGSVLLQSASVRAANLNALHQNLSSGRETRNG